MQKIWEYKFVPGSNDALCVKYVGPKTAQYLKCNGINTVSDMRKFAKQLGELKFEEFLRKKITKDKFIFNIMVEAFQVHPGCMCKSFPQHRNINFASSKTQDKLEKVGIRTQSQLLDAFVYYSRENANLFQSFLHGAGIQSSEIRYIINHIQFVLSESF